MKIFKRVLQVFVLAGAPVILGASLAFSAQCAAITKKGTQCKRRATAGSSFCWQHGGRTVPKTSQKAPSKETTKAMDSGDVSESTRCQAITKKGTQCKRQAEAGANYCWQHKEKVTEAAENRKTVPAAYKSTPSAAMKSYASDSTQCQAITKKGTQCRRKPKSGSRFCWQHSG